MTAGGNSPRIKGYSFEREVVNIARDHMHEAKRTPTSKKPDVVIDGHPVSCKRRANGFGWIYKELEEHDYILCRDDRNYIIQIQRWKP